QNVLAGRSDFELSEKGVQQLEDTVAGFCDITSVTSSPLKRCKLFAQQLANTRQLPLNIDSAIAEYDFGDWDGQRYEVLWQQSSSPTL
ncbi:histidine phosphatase family protein, partial [Streptomyces scabiei]|uniref:histidine phosphatase family protein n=1 Tax=Streptomyces scabiei TaxID=1930 RepID=UPI0038F70908